MPLIPPYGLRVPETTDQPDVVGDMLNFGEDVSDELVRIDSDIAGLVDDIEEAALGWTPIGAGEQSNVSAFVIDATAGGKYPPGTFSMMRLYLRGDMDGEAQWLSLNINDSLTE